VTIGQAMVAWGAGKFQPRLRGAGFDKQMKDAVFNVDEYQFGAAADPDSRQETS
jgi:hypothetical protein